MIKQLTLNNFQKHKTKVIKFSPHVNVISGKSDAGKSSIYRALFLISTNKPNGFSYITHGEKECSIKIETDSITVEKIRSKSKNIYKINDKELEAVGTSVPPQIVEALNLTEINFQSQHDNAFMLSETSGECGRMLNRYVDLTVIDRVLKDLNKRIKDNKQAAKFHSETACKHFEKVKSYKYLKNAEKSLRIALNVQESLSNAKSELVLAKDTVDGYLIRVEKITKLKESLKKLPDLDIIKIEEAKDKLEHIEKLMESVVEVKSKVLRYTELQKQIVDIPDIDFDSIYKLANKREKIKGKENNLHNDIDALEGKIEALKYAEQDYKTAKKEYEDERGDVCPLCGQKTI